MTTIKTKDKSYCIEHICVQCPGSLWGEKSICRIHNRSIGEVESCHEWDNFSEPSTADSCGEKTSIEVPEPALQWVEQVEDDLKDYGFMKREIVRLKKVLADAGFSIVAKYGIEAAQPNAKGTTSDKTYTEVARRERQFKRLSKLESVVTRLEHAYQRLTDEKEIVMMECFMEQKPMNHIARHIGVSRQYAYEIKAKLIHKLAVWIYGEDQPAG